MTRIITGAAGGRRLQTPEGTATRPTSDRVREALFSALESALGSFDGVRFLDLFAGSGAVGLEALSRGAAEAVLVERDRRTAALIARNARSLGLAGARVVPAKAETFITSAPDEPYDVIFCDPPYGYDSGAVDDLVAQVSTEEWLCSGGIVVVERPARGTGLTWPESVEATREKTYGESGLWYGRFYA